MNWTGESVLVTGGASFIGSHLVEALVDRGANVRVADDLSSGSLEYLSAVRDQISFFRGDLKRRAFADEVTEDINIVFHLAADHGGRGYIAEYPANCATNMALDTTVYEAAVDNGVERITFASSACVYPTDIQQDQVRLRESMVNFDERGGAYADEVYGWAKLMGERSLQAFEEQYDIDASIVRIFSAYGPRENETHAVMALIAKAYTKQDPFQVWGDGGQSRNFTYVNDIVKALRLAAEQITDGTAVNAGISRYVTINETIETIFDALDWEPNEIGRNLDKPVGVRHRAADTTRTEELLGWTPDVSFEEGIEQTVKWYQEEYDQEEVSQRLSTDLVER
jgi:UDP-glucose 4-epimerase